jgi:hypothetical protein
MKVHNRVPARKAVTTSRIVTHNDLSLAERHILNHYDVSPSLARTIARLAMLGGR